MLNIPYGTGALPFDETGAAVLTSRISELHAEKSGCELVREAMDAPIGSPRLRELAKGKRTCTVLISDHTRPVPSRDILPEMLRELREGSPEIEITLLVATGCHRAATRAELEAKLGKALADREKIVVHDCSDPDSNVQIGVLPSGAPCIIDRLAAQTELLVAEGFIEPHFFAGFSGGRKSVLPGICDRKTVYGNHCGSFIASPYCRTGILDGNPIHADMEAAARMARLAFIVNVVIDEQQRTAAAFAGDCVMAHRAGCEFLLRYCRVAAGEADIVITSNGGAPLDQNLYQCVKCMTAAEAICRKGGTIIVCAACADGHGGEGFYRTLAACSSVDALYAELSAVPQDRTVADQWQSQILARVLKDHRVILVTRPELQKTVEEMKMLYAADLDAALRLAGRTVGDRVTVIPNGVSVIAAKIG